LTTSAFSAFIDHGLLEQDAHCFEQLRGAIVVLFVY